MRGAPVTTTGADGQRSAGHARAAWPRLVGFLALKLVDGLLLGLLVTLVLLALHPFELVRSWLEPIELEGADLAMRYRIDARRYNPDPRVRPVVLILDEDEKTASWASTQSTIDRVRDVAGYAARRGAAAIVVDYAIWPAELPDCTRNANAGSVFCDRNQPPIIVAVAPPLIAKDRPRYASAWKRVPSWLCGAQPNVWYAHAVFDQGSANSTLLRGIRPWVWVDRPTAQGDVSSALPSVPLLAAELARRSTFPGPASAEGRQRRISEQFPETRPRPADCRQLDPGDRVQRIGARSEWIRRDRDATPIQILFEFDELEASQTRARSYGHLANHYPVYRVLSFSALLAAARDDSPAPGTDAPWRMLNAFDDAIVILGQGGLKSRDLPSTPLGSLPGAIALANAVHSFSTVGAPEPRPAVLLEAGVVVITSVLLTAFFWFPVWAWRAVVWPRRILATDAASLALRLVLFLTSAAFAAVLLALTIRAVFWTIDVFLLPQWSEALAGGEMVDFLLPGLLVMLKAVIEASGIFVVGLAEGSSIVLLKSFSRVPWMQRALRAAHHDMQTGGSHPPNGRTP
jgi:hypothetical protein